MTYPERSLCLVAVCIGAERKKLGARSSWRYRRPRARTSGAGRGLAEDLLLETAYQTAGTDAEEAIVKPFLAEDRVY